MNIGVIGGGQLGKMLGLKARKFSFDIKVLDPNPKCPASQVAEVVVGDLYDEKKIKELVEWCDITTFEIEKTNTTILKELYDDGYKIYPSPYVLEIIQDKYIQKEFLKKHNIPVPKYKKIDSLDEIKEFPVVLKARKGGYDGRGVLILKSEEDLKNAFNTPSYIEELVDIKMELAIMVARNLDGDIKCHPVVEMAFDERANICDTVIAPGRIPDDVKEEAKKIAIKIVEAFNTAGIFGIEMFLTRDNKILVNEIAPRVHNSGHYTIESCITCQFEQHLRAICNFPLGDTTQTIPAVMVNILGEGEGKPKIYGLNEALSIPGVSVHIYGKDYVKPFRKMGHITVVDKDINKAIEKANKVKYILKIRGEE
ncbi:5-(carboxyamino)imidazole ribonucleotide synthase [Methanocaldococcus indicus]|uniref:5-(carboxyamino)imidazole ribonucleotide synthase n=1 Tax=Methanocaldococcus indicus TaxID=213231 RepID=UPI003C6D00BD